MRNYIVAGVKICKSSFIKYLDSGTAKCSDKVKPLHQDNFFHHLRHINTMATRLPRPPIYAAIKIYGKPVTARFSNNTGIS